MPRTIRSVRGIAGALCLLLSLNVLAEDIEQTLALPSTTYLLTSKDNPAPGITAGPFVTIQENLAVGPQNIELLLHPESEHGLIVNENVVYPGEKLALEYETDTDGFLRLPIKSTEEKPEGVVKYTLTIPDLFSKYDAIPVISISDVSVPEGDSASKYVDVPLSLDIPAGRDVTVNYITKDVDATSIAGEARNLAYDSYGNPFIAVVDNPRGGRLTLDGGFPKFYNRTYSASGDQWRYLNNAIQWVKKENAGNSILLFGGKPLSTGGSYRVKGTGEADFQTSFSRWASDYGYSITIKDSNDFGGVGNVNIPLDYLNQFAAVIVMGSYASYVTIFNSTGVENFSDYSKLGGGLFLITDHNVFQTGVNQIASEFNLRFYGNVNRSPVSVAELEAKYGTHPLWEGLSVVPAGASEGNIDVSALDFSEIDYEGQGGTIVFKEGETAAKVSIRIFGNTVPKPDRSFSVVLSEPVNGVLPEKSVGTVTILNDD